MYLIYFEELVLLALFVGVLRIYFVYQNCVSSMGRQYIFVKFKSSDYRKMSVSNLVYNINKIFNDIFVFHQWNIYLNTLEVRKTELNCLV